MNSYEQNGFRVDPMLDEDDPRQFSLSTYEKPKDVKRFASMDSDMHVPFKIAIGFTVPVYGLAQRTRERIKKRDSHVDWWLYKDATPYANMSQRNGKKIAFTCRRKTHILWQNQVSLMMI